MQKIKYDFYNRIITSDLTRLELKFMFYLLSRCNASGEVTGVYYADIAEDLECSVAKFYHLRDSLSEKGFLTWMKNTSADLDITLCGNDFQIVEGQIVYENYVDINIAIFHDPQFWKQKAGAIKIAMEFIKRVSANAAVTTTNLLSADKSDAERRRKLWYLPYNELKKLAAMIHVSKRMISKYLISLNPWISVAHGIQVGEKVYDIVTVHKEALLRTSYTKRSSGRKKKEHVYAERYEYLHYVRTLCRRKKMSTDPENLSDTADLIRQYENSAKIIGKNIFSILSRAITNTFSNVLNSYNIHNALRYLLNYG